MNHFYYAFIYVHCRLLLSVFVFSPLNLSLFANFDCQSSNLISAGKIISTTQMALQCTQMLLVEVAANCVKQQMLICAVFKG